MGSGFYAALDFDFMHCLSISGWGCMVVIE